MRIKNIILLIIFIFSSLICFAEEDKKVIQLISPNGREVLNAGVRYGISWYSKNINEISIFFSVDNEKNWTRIIARMKGELGSYSWKVPNISTEYLKIKIESSNNESVFDTSDEFIQILAVGNQNILNKNSYNTSNVLKILPLGNSITFDHRSNDTRIVEDKIGYRFPLYNMLKDSNYIFDFIGSEHAGSNFFLPEIGFNDNAGFPGIKGDELYNLLKTGVLNMPFYTILDTITDGPYLESYQPDIILLHIGTNGNDDVDGTSAVDIENILNEIDRFEDSTNVSIIVFLAKIINRSPNQSYVSTFNNNVEAMAIDRVQNSINSAFPDKIVMVDIEGITDFNYTISPDPAGAPGDMNDNLHPNDKGYAKLAKAWFDSLQAVIGNPVKIISQPSSIFVVVGDTAIFKVSASGTKPYSYQWLKNGMEIIGETNSVLSIYPVNHLDDNSLFSCLISNSFSSQLSEEAQLTTIVLEKPDQVFASLGPDNTIELTWRDNSDNEDGFLIKRLSTLDTNYVIIDTNITNDNFYVDNSVSDGIKYNYIISSYLEFGESESDEKFTIIVPLLSPTNLDGSLDEENNSVLFWEDNSSNELGYIVEGKPDHPDSIFNVIDTAEVNSTLYIDISDKFYSPYVYRVYAVSSDTISDPSNTFSMIVVGKSKTENDIPSTYFLSQNFPNPFNPVTRIEYSLPEISEVSIIIYNILGEPVTELVNRVQNGGSYYIEINASDLTSGVYFYTMNARNLIATNQYNATRKLLLIK